MTDYSREPPPKVKADFSKKQKKKISILYISHSAELYGAEQCLLTLLDNLDKDRFTPVVVLPKDGPLRQKLLDSSTPVEIIPTMRGWLSRKNKAWQLFHLIAVIPFMLISILKLKRLINNYDIDLVHTNSLVIIDGALAAKFYKIPHVWHAREILQPETYHKFFFGPKAAIAIIKWLSQRIIAISKAVYKNFEHTSQSAQTRVIYDGLKLADNQVPYHRQNIRELFNLPEDAFLIGEIAQVSPAKGYEDLVMAANIVRHTIPNAIFLGIGGTQSNPTYKQKLEALIMQHSLQDHFKFIGFCDNIPELLSNLDLLILPSHYEPFGLVLIEAMAAGKPVIGTEVGGIPEIIDHERTGLLVPPCAPQTLAKAIINILQDPAKAQEMGRNGQQRVRNFFSPKEYKKLEAIYQELIPEL